MKRLLGLAQLCCLWGILVAPPTDAQNALLERGRAHYRNGDYAEANAVFEQGVAAGNPACIDFLGFLILEGHGKEESPSAALGYFRKAAELGNDQACRNLGNMYFGGRGVDPDSAQAAAWWEKSVELGTDPRPAFSLGQLHWLGSGVPQNAELARTHWNVAKNRGSGDAVVALAVCDSHAPSAAELETLQSLAAKGHVTAQGALKFLELRQSGTKSLVRDTSFVHQAHNFCALASSTMLLRHQGAEVSQFDVARTRRVNRWGRGSHWDEMVRVAGKLGRQWKIRSFDMTEKGFAAAKAAALNELNSGRALVIDILKDGDSPSAHSILLCGYDPETNEFLGRNSALPFPGYQVFSEQRLKEIWRSRGFLPNNTELRRPMMLAANAPDPQENLGFSDILLVQRHMIKSSHVYTYHEEDNKPGGGLFVFDCRTGETKQILSSDNGLILDANLHYDGKTVLFSWKRNMSDTFQLYTVQIDGTNLKQITDHASNNFNASWLPNDEIVFLSDRKPAFAYCWRTTTPILFKSKADGSRPARISANYLNDFTPAVMEDGRIIYGRWEYVDRPAIPIQGLWTINSDGTNLSGLFGNRVLSPATFMDAREIPGSKGKILCVMTAHNRHCHGAIGIIDPSIGGNAQEAIQNLTPEIDIGRVDKGSGNHIRGPYVNPFPLDSERYLVSRDGSIQMRYYQGSNVVDLVAGNAKGLGFYSPQPVRTRTREKLVASGLAHDGSEEEDVEWAEVSMMDVYNGLPPSIERGSIKKLAIIQEVEKPLGIDPGRRAFGFQFPVVSAGATYAPKMVWGFANVEKDGSAFFKVPARRPIYFLPLDENGMAVQRMRTFTHFMPGERQGCIGCHADRNYVVNARVSRPEALARGAEPLQEPGWGVKGFSYAREVQPILDAHCIKCHGRSNPEAGLELTGDKTDFFNVSYENLVRRGTPAENFTMGGTSHAFKPKYVSWIPTYNGQEANILKIEPGRWGAKNSLLAKVIQTGHEDREGKPRIQLSDDERLRLCMWMDLNVPYYESSDSNYRANRGCRQQIPPGFGEAFKEVATRRCVECHTQKGNDQVFSYPNQFALRLDHPELNPILQAPLATEAGGSGQCGKAVFLGTDDTDYQKLIATFDRLKKALESNPRLDMASTRTACADTEPAKPERPVLQILNGSEEAIDIYWLKSAQKRVPNGTVAPGKGTSITTTLGHRFAIVGRKSHTEKTVTSEVPIQAFRFDPPDDNGIPAFYTQRVSANGLPIVGSAKVNPYALKEAAYLVNLMLAKRPDVRTAMIRSGARLCILAHNEYTTEQPEFVRMAESPMAKFPEISGKDYWDARARGLGGSKHDPFCSCAEENLLGYPGDPYSDECILIHELAHNIHLRGLVNVDPTFDSRLEAAYDAAMEAGLWKGKYAGVNHHEYFAEGVQSWFDDNRENDHDHNHVDTREELLEYDPGLARICREVFGDTELRYSKPVTRLHGHMDGYDPTTAPQFKWPDRLKNAKKQISLAVKKRSEAS